MDQRVSFSIGDVAKASELSIKAIRYYEEIGLIPKARRTNGGLHTGGRRVYTEADVGRLRFIRHARLFGFGLRDIREMLALRDSSGCPSRKPEYRQILKKHLRSIDQRIGHLLGLRTAIAGLVSRPHNATATRCTWETCDCMRQNGGAGRSSAMLVAKNSKHGGTHV